ncbi:MAG: protein translocase subunit SecD [Hyphomicrobiaceae bacterium]
MLHFSRGKVIAILAVCLFGFLACLPNFLAQSTLDKLPNFLPKQKINLGLDLQGGAHVLAGMDVDELKRDWLEKIRDSVNAALRKDSVPRASVGIAQGGVVVRLNKPEDMDAAWKSLRDLPQPIAGADITGSSARDLEVTKQGNDAVLIKPTEAGTIARVSSAISSASEIVRNRCDPGGNKEMVVQRQGADRILLQAPGIEDIKVIEPCFDVAKLTFHLVHPTVSVDEARTGRVPPGYKILPSRDGGEELIESRSQVTGEQLTDAQPGFDQRTNEPIVSFRFNQSGARTFGKLSSENVGRRFAVVLDNKVITAPRINEPILGGSGQITGNFGVAEAASLATNLRSGALPAKLTIVEQRVVGASLGADSIKAGQRAAMIGTLAVVGFMTFAYGLFGVFAIIAVALNVLLVIAVMSLIGSTLTLPGIAGIVLTIGMAVDANVLIYERMREELRNGKTTIAALDAGFDKALSSIVDANLTTLIAGIVMFWLGSGPIRGFAVTLSLGILTTVFTAFTITRLLVAWWLHRQTDRKIAPPLSFKHARH